jgi:hypothetical protein
MINTKIFSFYNDLFFIVILLISNVNARFFQENNKYYVEQELREKWNLIAGISFNEEVHPKSELNLDSIFNSYYYDAKFKKNIEIRPNYSVETTDVLSLYSNAFWVFSAVPGIIVYRVSPSFEYKSRLGGYYKFYSGDNLISINDDMYGNSLNEISGNCNIIEANFWDADKQNWTEIQLDQELDFESRNYLVGKGINVKVKEDCDFFNKDVKKNSEYDCTDWSECENIYDLTNIIDNNISFKGERKRYCIDLHTFVINSESIPCNNKKNILLNKIKDTYKDILEISDNNNYFISNLVLSDNKLDINFPIEKEKKDFEIKNEELFKNNVNNPVKKEGRIKNFVFNFYCKILNFYSMDKYLKCVSRFIF